MKQIKKEKYDKVYMAVVDTLKQLSHDKKRKVAALLVRKKHIIAEGINGTPKKMSNICRDENEKTFWYVLHAEANAILKCAKKGIKTKNATLYVSLSPCKECAKLILQAGIKRVIYKEDYKDLSGINFLRERNIIVDKMD